MVARRYSTLLPDCGAAIVLRPEQGPATVFQIAVAVAVVSAVSAEQIVPTLDIRQHIRPLEFLRRSFEMTPSDSALPDSGSQAPTALSAGLKARCPRCGKGKLFKQVLNLRDSCDNCGMDYQFIDAGDGPAIFVMFLLGAAMVGAALFVEFTFEPPLWLHAVLWLPVTLLLAVLLLRPFKATLIALQYRNKAEQGRMESP